MRKDKEDIVLSEYQRGEKITFIAKRHKLCKKDILRFLTPRCELWHTNEYKEKLILSVYSHSETINSIYKKVAALTHEPASRDLIRKILRSKWLPTTDYHRKNFDIVSIIRDELSKGKCISDIATEYKTCAKKISKIIKDNDIPFNKSAGLGRAGAKLKGRRYVEFYKPISKEKKREYSLRTRLKNKEKIKQRKKEYARAGKKAESDKRYYSKTKHIPEMKLIRRFRSFISMVCKKNKIVKNSKTFSILGYDHLELMYHLESKWVEGMSWDNYGRGGWHIDHIVPLVYFNITNEEDLQKAFALENLQPLWESENCSKGSLYNGVRYRRDRDQKQY